MVVTGADDFGQAMNIDASRFFVPPSPLVPPDEPSLLQFITALRTNRLQIWSAAAYERDTLVESFSGAVGS